MMNDVANIGMWLDFSVFVLIALGINTFYLNKKSHLHNAMRTTLYGSLAWIAAAFIFNGLLCLYCTLTPLDFLFEKSLSVDNLFAFALAFYCVNKETQNEFSTSIE